jgi:hypothetical protein
MKTTTARMTFPLTLLLLCLAAVAPARADEPAGPIFPQPFVVEHQVVQSLPDGDVFATEPVTDYYGGSWIVSVRADGSRQVVDLSRRELTEIRPERGTFSVLSFDRFAELVRRFNAVEAPVPAKSGQGSGDAPEPRFAVSEVPALQGLEGKSARPGGGDDALIKRSGVRRLAVKAFEGDAPEPRATMDLWLDPEIRLTPRALAAMESFEATVVNAGAAEGTLTFADLTAEARKASGGALAFRTSRPMVMAYSDPGPRTPDPGSVDDIALRVDTIDSFPMDLLEVPEGFVRAPHPLEIMVSHAEDEAELRAVMSGESQQ